MAKRIFQVRLTNSFKKGAKADGGQIDEITRQYARVIAEYIQGRVRKVLSPRYTLPSGLHPVGASGSASENIRISLEEGAQGSGSSGRIVYAVYEGDSTPANELIRKGIPKGDVTIGRLRQWAGEKGLTFSKGGKGKEGAVKLKKVSGYTRSDGTKVDSYIRGKGGSRSEADRALYAIRALLIKYGTNREPEGEQEGPNWLPLYPGGQGRFDYIQEITISDQETLKRMGARAGKEVTRLIMERMSSGRKSGWYGLK